MFILTFFVTFDTFCNVVICVYLLFCHFYLILAEGKIRFFGKPDILSSKSIGKPDIFGSKSFGKTDILGLKSIGKTDSSEKYEVKISLTTAKKC